MVLKFKRETKIIFIILGLIILGAVIYIAVNYRKLKQPAPVPQNLAAQAQVEAANVPLLPRGE